MKVSLSDVEYGMEKAQMSTILVTGTSGFIGKAFASSLAERHNVICMSRKDPGLGLTHICGEFHSPDDLKLLDKFNIDAVVHLAAVTGGGSEEECLKINAEGTRRLMQYLIDRGCKKFVLASSIAVVGIQRADFKPLQFPISDEHPCLDCGGYGFSKYIMEEVSRYKQRQSPAIDVINIRLCSICPDDKPAELVELGKKGEWAFAMVAIMCLSDAVRAFTMAVESPMKPGVRVMNASAPRTWCKPPVADLLHAWYGDNIDASYFEKPGNKWASVFDVNRIKEEIGFEAKLLPSGQGEE
ncbi:MAG: NAD(P)-dependent oxidoreductase [bacterium]